MILAEGLTVESYLDTGDRANFAGAETIRLHPDFAARPGADTALAWETKGAAPLVMAGAGLRAARRMTTAREAARRTAMRGLVSSASISGGPDFVGPEVASMSPTRTPARAVGQHEPTCPVRVLPFRATKDRGHAPG